MMFAEKLKTLRKQKGLTQTKFAKDFNIATGTIGMWETGKRQPEKTGTSYTTFRQWYEGTGDYFNDKLYLIADLYNVSIDYLLGRQEQLPELNNKDQKEIQKILDETKEQLLSQDGLMFDGVPATEEDVQKIIMAMQMGMEMIKKENKAKFTPKKYRKNN